MSATKIMHNNDRDSSNVVVGRSRDCDLVLKHPTISGRHVRLAWQGEQILVEDVGSANGTFVDGKRIERALVRPGDEVWLGGALLPWSNRKLRHFLRRGSLGDTIHGFSVPGHRFVCGSCGVKGIMPPHFSGGTLECGACKTRLIVGQPKRSWVTALFMWLLVIGAIAGSLMYLGAHHRPELRRAAERLGIPTTPDRVRSTSEEEATIRAYTVEKVKAAMNAEHPLTRNTAAQLAAQDEGPFSVEQVARIWSHVRGEWSYVNDPQGSEYFALASESIENGFIGDCDDFAIVVASMTQAIGGRSRIVMMDGPEGGHAYAEVCVPGESADVRGRLQRHYRRHRDKNLGRQRVRQVHYRPAEDCPVWLNLDWNAGVPGGPYESEAWAVAVYPDGVTETLAPASAPE